MQTPTFDLHKLGWKAFEDLVACILKETLGQTYQIFADGPDGGRDGAFSGTWKPAGTDDAVSGAFSVQCKHTGKQGASLAKAIVDEELPKVKRLAGKGLADNYFLFTNCSVSAQAAEKFEAQFRSAGAKRAHIYGAEWINHSIATNPSLRRLVPRLYGLGDLTQIVTHQAYRQAKDVLDSIAPDLACFVPTEAYRSCAHALKEHGFVMLIGEPASGKTMIANLLALSAADEWNLQTLILSSPQDLDKKWNPDDPGQFFWVDDAFGSNHCDFARVDEWNHRLPQLKAAIHKGARVIFTSRSYIFRAMKNRLNSHKFELFNDSRVTIEVEKLTGTERAMILYNHVKLGGQPTSFRRKVKGFLPTAAATPKFLPEIARRFSNPKFTSKLVQSEKGVQEFFANPTSVMADIVSGLANAERAALGLVFASGGSLPIPLPADELATNTIAAMQSNVGDVKAALSSMEDSLLRKVTDGGSQHWRFRHPTIRDAFASNVAENPELVDIYLAGVTKERLVEEISCGDMGIEGIKLIVPQPLYGKVLGIIAPDGGEQAISSPILSFLAGRCSAEFLRLFFAQGPAVEKLPGQIHWPNRFDSALAILGKLNTAGVLPNTVRLSALSTIRRLAERDHSTCFIDGDFVGTLITEKENADCLRKQQRITYACMDEIIGEVEEGWTTDEDVDDAFYYVKTLIDRINEENQARYGEDDYDETEPEAYKKFVDAIESKTEELKHRQSQATDYDELETEESASSELVAGRSIFDDVDE